MARSQGWQPGTSGNPGGRPKSTSAEYVRRLVGKSGRALFDAAYEIVQDPSRAPGDRIHAATFLRDSAFGVPVYEPVKRVILRTMRSLFGDNFDVLVTVTADLLQDELGVNRDVAEKTAAAMIRTTADQFRMDVPKD